MEIESEFHRAARDGFLDPLRSATRRDLNMTNEDGMTPTSLAAAYGNLSALRLIIGRGGSPDKCDFMGFTALHHASNNGHVDVVSYLLNFGCNVWSMDNDLNTALDVAAIQNRTEIVKILDEFQDRELRLNAHHVKKMKERALEEAERNAKRFERTQEKARRHAEKEERLRMQIADPDFKPQKNIFKTLTMRFKGKKLQAHNESVRQYSDLTGVKKKISQKYGPDGTSMYDFKTSEYDDTGKRTLRSLKGTIGMAKGADVLFVSNESPDGTNTTSSSARPALSNVFPGQFRNKNWKSEPDLIDSGIDDSVNEEDEGAPGVFYRPGFGGLAFLRSGMAGTFDGFNKAPPTNYLDGPSDDPNETEATNGSLNNGVGSESIGSATSLEERMHNDIPFRREDLDEIDDDEEEDSKFSDLVRFLDACGLSNYINKFTAEDMDLEALMLVNDNDLKDIGIGLGPRKKLLDAISKRKQVLDNPPPITDSFL